MNLILAILTIQLSSLLTPSKLTIKIEGLFSEKGNLHFALYRKSDPFPDFKSTYRNRIVSSKNRQISFNDLQQGEYALAVFHDENKNGKLDKNLFGVPSEKYGFSNNARGIFSAPNFLEAAFSLSSDKTISITLK